MEPIKSLTDIFLKNNFIFLCMFFSKRNISTPEKYPVSFDLKLWYNKKHILA